MKSLPFSVRTKLAIKMDDHVVYIKSFDLIY
jgi:hypothetical protein